MPSLKTKQMNDESKTLTFEKVTEKVTFTTHSKKPKTTINICRKGSVVKERCKQLVDVIVEMFPERVLSDDDLTCLIQDYIGADKETVRSYRGYGGHIRAGRCGDNHVVGLSRKGYLETFGFLRKVPGRRWMIVQAVLSEGSISSQAMSREVSYPSFYSPNGSNEKISISPVQVGCVVSGSSSGSNDGSSRRLEEEEATEKERNFAPMISPMIRDISDLDILSAEEKRILQVKTPFIPEGGSGVCPP